jgi:hypothetical protein
VHEENEKKIRGNRGRNFTFIINQKSVLLDVFRTTIYNNGTQRYVRAEVKKGAH